MNKNNIILLMLVFITSGLMLSCDKKEQKKKDPNMTKAQINDQSVMPESFTLGGLNVNDTSGRIKGLILVPSSKIKDNPIAVKPIMELIEKEFKAAAEIINKKDKKEKYSFVEVRPYYFYTDKKNVSCLIRKSISYAGGDTVLDYKTITYDYKVRKQLGFDDIFLVNESNLSDFLALFDKTMSNLKLENLKQIDFNIENDSISFNVKQDKIENKSTQKRFKQSRTNLIKYLNKRLID